MRISDWSSDVCSSDLLAEHVDERVHYFVTLGVAGMVLVALRPHLFVISSVSLITLASLVVIDGWPTTASQQMAVAIFLFAMFLLWRNQDRKSTRLNSSH